MITQMTRPEFELAFNSELARIFKQMGMEMLDNHEGTKLLMSGTGEKIPEAAEKSFVVMRLAFATALSILLADIARLKNDPSLKAEVDLLSDKEPKGLVH